MARMLLAVAATLAVGAMGAKSLFDAPAKAGGARALKYEPTSGGPVCPNCTLATKALILEATKGLLALTKAA